MILPAIEVQPAVQAAGKQGAQSAAGTSEDTFSAAFGQSLRETAQGQSVPSETEVDSKTPVGTDGKAVSGQAGQVPQSLAAEISGRVAEATAQAAKQTVSQAAAGTVAAAPKAPFTLLKATGAGVLDVAKSSAGAATEAVEKDLSLTEPPAVASGTANARVTTESAGKSNLVKASNGDEKLVAAGSEVAKSDAASAGVAAAGARAAGLVNAASTVAVGKAGAADQTPETKVAAGASAGKVTAAPVAILAGAVKPDVATLFALNSEPKSTAVKAGAELGDTATALKDTNAVTSAGTPQGGKVAPVISDGEQVETLAGAASTQIQSTASATGAAAASSGVLSGVSVGAIQAKTPVTAKAVPAHVTASSGTKVQGAKSGVSGAGAAVAGGKGTALETSISQANAAEGVLPQRGTGDPAVQTAALEVPAASAAASATPSAATVAASLASSLASRFAMLGVPFAQAEQAQGDAIKPGADAKTGSKATGTAPGLEPDAKSGVAKAASSVSSNGVVTAPVAVHPGATQVGTASVQAIAAAHVLPTAVPANSVVSSKSGAHSAQSAGSSAQAASGRPAAAASVQPPVTIEDKGAVAGAAVTVQRPAVEGRAGDSGQQSAGLNAGQSAGLGSSRTGLTSTASQASTPAQATTQTTGAATSTAASPTFSEVAATAGIHAATAPAGAPSAPSGPNGAIAATTGVIAAGHPAAVAGVAAGPGAAGPSAAGSVSSTLSGVGGAARSDLATAAEPHRTLVATPNTLEVGVPDGTQGWLRIRAEVGDQGQVNASLAAASGASQEMLHRELPALNAYLHSEQMAVTATVSDRSFTAAGGGQTLAGGGDTSGAGAGAMTQGGTPGGQQSGAGQQGTATASSVQSYSGTAGLSEATIANSSSVGYDGESGRWLNVRA